MNTLRWSLVAMLVALAIAGSYYILAGGTPPPPRPERAWQNAQCRPCHPGVWSEWYGSWHRRAYIDPLYEKLSNNYTDASCDDCHIPRNIPEVGFGPRTLPRASDKRDGISCLSCHYDGRDVVAVRGNPAAGCRPRAAPELGTELACIGCHNQHKLHEEWRRTPYFQRGIGCIDCHMPPVDRPRGDRVVRGRHHGFIASRNRDPGRRAVAVQVIGPHDPGGTPGTLKVSITNREIGHDFPSDSRFRAADLITRFFKGGDRRVGETRRERFHIPKRDALDQTRTTIPCGETRSFAYAIPAGAAYAEVQLLYRILKDDPNVDAQQLFRRIVKW